MLNEVSASLLVQFALKAFGLEQLMFLSGGCIFDQGKIQLKNYTFGVTLIRTVFCGHTFSPPNPSCFILGHPNMSYHVLSCGYFAALQTKQKYSPRSPG